MAGSRCGMKGASSLPRRLPPVRYSSETATDVPHLFLSRPPTLTAWANAGPRLSNHWTQGQWKRRIKGTTLTARPLSASPNPPPLASPNPASPRKPTFLQRERWKAIQKARRKGMSLRAIERELGIHRATIKKYLAAEGPPTQQPWAGPTGSTSDTPNLQGVPPTPRPTHGVRLAARPRNTVGECLGV